MEGISIIMSAYKTKNYIQYALDSISGQHYLKNNDNYEILVGVDSCRETLNRLLEIKDNYNNLRVFMMSSNKGTYITSNTLIEISKYNYIIRFDSDDVMREDLLEKAMSVIKQGDFVSFKYQRMSADWEFQLSGYNDFHNGCVLFNKRVFDSLGGYEPWVCTADKDLLKRARINFKEVKINEQLLLYRKHNQSLTKLIPKQYRKILNKKSGTNRIKIPRVINKYTEY